MSVERFSAKQKVSSALQVLCVKYFVFDQEGVVHIIYWRMAEVVPFRLDSHCFRHLPVSPWETTLQLDLYIVCQIRHKISGAALSDFRRDAWNWWAILLFIAPSECNKRYTDMKWLIKKSWTGSSPVERVLAAWALKWNQVLFACKGEGVLSRVRDLLKI